MKKLCIFTMLLCLCLTLAACKKPAEQPDITTAPTSGKVNVEMDIQGADFVSYTYTDNVYYGVMKVKVTCSVDGEFTVTSKYSDPVTVSLKAGENTVALPCQMDSLTVSGVFVTFTKVDSGEIFDKMCKLKATTELINVNMTLPGYRDSFYPGQDSSKVSGKLAVEKKVTVKLEGPGIEAQVVTTDANGDFAFETPNFEIGEATLSLVIDGCDVAAKTISKLAPSEHTMTWIENGAVVVNGEPIVRRDIYAPEYRVSTVDKEKFYSDNLYQTLELLDYVDINYAVFHDRGTEHQKDAIPSQQVLKRVESYINQNKNTNFGFYYLADEPGWKNTSPVYLKYIYDFIKERDPYHVIVIGENQEYQTKWVECCDWLEIEIYINPKATEDGRVLGHPMYEIGANIDELVSLNRQDKCVGVLPQCYRGTATGYVSYSDYPTFDELFCSTWVGLTHGAKSVWPYAGHDLHDRPRLYEGIRYLFSSIDALEDLLVSGERTVLKRTDVMEAVLWTKGNEKLLVVINLTQETQSVTVEGLSGTWYNFRHDGTFSGNEFELEPLEVLIGTSSIKDADLPSYDETVALIEELELERISGGGLLFERYDDIPITKSSTTTLTSLKKLFDGMQMNHACLIKGTGEKFLELDLTKVKPTFNKVVVSGWQVDEMEIEIYIDGELVALEIEEVQKEEYSTTFILKEAVSPDALRLEFHKDRLEVYEVEVFNTVE